MQLIPPYPNYGYFRRNVAGKNAYALMDDDRDAQLADLSILAYSDNDFIAGKLKSPNSPFVLLDVVDVGEVQAIVAKYGNGVVVAFRGTRTFSIKDWKIDIDCKINDKGAHEGFYDAFMPLVGDISPFINGLPTVFTGHSLGAALATVAVSEICHITEGAALVTFGSPMAGNGAFAARVNIMLDRGRRYVHGDDIVPKLPLKLLGFEHVSQACFLKQMPRPLVNVLAPRDEFDHVPTWGYAERLWEEAA